MLRRMSLKPSSNLSPPLHLAGVSIQYGLRATTCAGREQRVRFGPLIKHKSVGDDGCAGIRKRKMRCRGIQRRRRARWYCCTSRLALEK